MANGELCRHCGWQETEHDHSNLVASPKKRRVGYRKAFASCTGFASEAGGAVEEAKPASYFEALERRGEARAAWNLYAALIRQHNFDRELAKLSGEEREDFIKEGKRQNAQGFWIG